MSDTVPITFRLWWGTIYHSLKSCIPLFPSDHDAYIIGSYSSSLVLLLYSFGLSQESFISYCFENLISICFKGSTTQRLLASNMLLLTPMCCLLLSFMPVMYILICLSPYLLPLLPFLICISVLSHSSFVSSISISLLLWISWLWLWYPSRSWSSSLFLLTSLVMFP